MEYLSVLAFVIVLCYMSYPDKVKKLERKVKKLEKERCRESIMPKLIEELVGTRGASVSRKLSSDSGTERTDCAGRLLYLGEGLLDSCAMEKGRKKQAVSFDQHLTEGFLLHGCL